MSKVRLYGTFTEVRSTFSMPLKLDLIPVVRMLDLDLDLGLYLYLPYYSR